MLKHSYTFGLSEWEIFWTLCSGGTLLLPRVDGEKDAGYLYGLMREHGVACAVFVPSVLRAVLEYAALEEQPESGDAPLLPCLRHVVTCGEALTADLVHGLADLMPHAALDNLCAASPPPPCRPAPRARRASRPRPLPSTAHNGTRPLRPLSTPSDAAARAAAGTARPRAR